MTNHHINLDFSQIYLQYRYTAKVYHGTPYGGFNEFNDWSFFTENIKYAERFMNPSASSIRGKYEDATRQMIYGLYMNPGRVFDTREKFKPK